jgi:NAD(P)-dependent dehydrogenase (short-subunit alcohol dehydrogenase family)/acyl carrier protein
LGVISEKTGYPEEMLEPGMALDTDLGIDSIKRVEILSALQEKLPEAPVVKPEHLGTLQTVGQIVDFLASVSGFSEEREIDSASDQPRVGKLVERQVLMSTPLESDCERTPIKLSRHAKIWITDDGSELSEKICHRLNSNLIKAEQIALDHLSDLSPPQDLAGLIILSPAQGADDLFLQKAFQVVQLSEPVLNAAGRQGNVVVATVSRLDGQFGLSQEEQVYDVLSGGLSGLVKTVGHEWKGVSCKSFDISATFQNQEQLADILVEQLLLDGPQEIGVTQEGLFALNLVDMPLETFTTKLPLGYGDVIAISGGARGITAESAVALAEASHATLLLLGRSAPPKAEPAWLAGLEAEADIKKALLAHADEELTPRELGQKYKDILANREIRKTLQRIKSAGGQALYRSVDLRDRLAVQSVMEDVRSEYGSIKGLVHGSGILADRLIKDKTLEQFHDVYSTKVDGLRNLLLALDPDDLRFMVIFSSSTGRFGRKGQVDYAVANEVLNKMAQRQSRLHANCRVLSLNWGPWDGGMVTPALKKVFASEGISVIDLKAGAEFMVAEIASKSGGEVEQVIMGKSDDISKDDPSTLPDNIYVSKAFDLELSIEQFPFLASHVMDNKAVLPVAVMIEWMAHGALHNNPGLRFHGFNDLRVLKGVILQQKELHTLQVMTGKAFKSGGVHVVPVELSGVSLDGRHLIHARSRIILSAQLPESKPAMPRAQLNPYSRSLAEIYQTGCLFHGEDFHGIREVLGSSGKAIASVVRPAPLPSNWIKHPLRNSWLADPLALDGGFQSMILWSFERYKSGSLPVFTGRYRQYRNRFPENGVEIRIAIIDENTGKAVADMDFVDLNDGSLVARIEGYECVIDRSLNASFQKNKLLGAA